jgi:hypothetical protein
MVSLIDLLKMKGYSSKFLLILTRSLWCLPFNFQNEDFKGSLAWSFSKPTFLMFLLSRFPFFSLFSSSFPIFVFPFLAFKVCLKDMFRVQEAATTTLYIGLYVF